MDEVDRDAEGLGLSAWAAFGDLMAGVLGAFVLVLAAALVTQLDLATRLDQSERLRLAEQQRRAQLERALAGPLADGRISLVEGRIGISGAVLFAPGSDQLHDEGRALVRSLAGPLTTYLAQRNEVLMVSGFTDDRAVRDGTRGVSDNWALSTQRALTVVRSLLQDGVPADAVFAAGFGPQRPVASNETAEGRALNRRVEIAPMPRPQAADPLAPPAGPR